MDDPGPACDVTRTGFAVKRLTGAPGKCSSAAEGLEIYPIYNLYLLLVILHLCTVANCRSNTHSSICKYSRPFSRLRFILPC